ncbi:hypothetical protein GCM10027360_43480 [Amycolatopsis echigonensis]
MVPALRADWFTLAESGRLSCWFLGVAWGTPKLDCADRGEASYRGAGAGLGASIAGCIGGGWGCGNLESLGRSGKCHKRRTGQPITLRFDGYIRFIPFPG